MLPRDYSGQNCSVARALEVLGERWTMLVLRDAFQGVTRFELFARRLKIAPNILTKRLATLVEFARKTTPATRGIRLRFAEKGALTVDSFRIENDQVICVSAATGELTFPLAQLSEIIYSPDIIPAPSYSPSAAAPEDFPVRPMQRILVR